MCGRYALTYDAEALQEMFQIDFLEAEWQPRYNVAPSQRVPVVLNRGGGRVLALHRWGLVPYWAKDPAIGDKMINARSETVAEKHSFKLPLRQRRCLVLADGFYEWRAEGRSKTPYFVHLLPRRPFAMAGLWDVWSPPHGEAVRSCTVLTTVANELMARLHQRMPVILTDPAVDLWLDPSETDPARLLPLLRPFPADAMVAYPVSRLVNSPAYDSPQCIEPVPESEGGS